jgi:hypothetical protein
MDRFVYHFEIQLCDTCRHTFWKTFDTHPINVGFPLPRLERLNYRIIYQLGINEKSIARTCHDAYACECKQIWLPPFEKDLKTSIELDSILTRSMTVSPCPGLRERLTGLPKTSVGGGTSLMRGGRIVRVTSHTPVITGEAGINYRRSKYVWKLLNQEAARSKAKRVNHYIYNIMNCIC